MGHVHDHDHHAPGHVHAPASFGKTFAIGISLNSAFALIEVSYILVLRKAMRSVTSSGFLRPGKTIFVPGTKAFGSGR